MFLFSVSRETPAENEIDVKKDKKLDLGRLAQ